MKHKDLREFIREELRHGEINELFGWARKAWRDLTLSDWEIVNKAARNRAPGILPLTSAQWRALPRDVRDRLTDAAHDWLDDPSQYDPNKWGLKMIRAPHPGSWGRDGSGRGSGGRSSGKSSGGGGGGSWGGGSGGGYGYYDPYDPYGYGYGYGYYGGGTSGRSDRDTRGSDKDKDRDKDEDRDKDDSDSTYDY